MEIPRRRKERPRRVGLVHVQVTLRPLQNRRKKYQANFLVDTRAANCMAPAFELERAGIRREGTTTDAEGSEIDYGFARIELMGDVTAGRVMFGPEGAVPVVGMTALTSLGYVVDPQTNDLRRLPAIPLKSNRVEVTPDRVHRCVESASCAPS